MYSIECEHCGSNDLIKQDNYFICQHCGSKYSIENAKKVLGTVKVDNSDEISNLYKLARRAKTNKDFASAQDYYEKILLKDPSNWEANFFSAYFKCLNLKIGELHSAVEILRNCQSTNLLLIKSQYTQQKEISQAILSIGKSLIYASETIYNNYIRFHYSHVTSTYHPDNNDLVSITVGSCEILSDFGDNIISVFGKEYSSYSIGLWKKAILMYKFLGDDISAIPINLVEDKINTCGKKIKEFEPSYIIPKIEVHIISQSAMANSHCYIATSIYGTYDCPEVWVLRRFRDNFLDNFYFGRMFISFYYYVSPLYVEHFSNFILFKKFWRLFLDFFVNILKKVGYIDTPYFDKY